eukprot:COSAG06_NODE_6669_length_2834_cov_1.658135_5_plen_56_part_00
MKTVVVERNESDGVRVKEGAVAVLEDCSFRENHPDYETMDNGRIEGIDQGLINRA